MSTLAAVPPPTGAPILALEEARQALRRDARAEGGRPDLRRGRDPRHRRRERRRQIDADQALDRRLSALVRRGVLARRAGRARHPARGDRSRHQRGASGSRAVPAPDRRRQYLPRRRGDAQAACSAPQAHGARRPRSCSTTSGSICRPTCILSSLTIGQQQLVATARAERRGAKFLIFDEPTAYLTRQETAALFTLIRRLKAKGVTIVYISHRLEEVFELCDRVSVLRDGALVGTRRIGETNEADLIALMINRTIEQIYYKECVPIGATILETDRPVRPGLPGRFDAGARRRDRRALRPDRRGAQRVRAERVRPLSSDERPHVLAGQATSRSAANGRRWTLASRSRRRAGAIRASASISASASTSTCRSSSA